MGSEVDLHRVKQHLLRLVLEATDEWRLYQSCIRWRPMQPKSVDSAASCALVCSASAVAALSVRQEAGAWQAAEEAGLASAQFPYL